MALMKNITNTKAINGIKFHSDKKITPKGEDAARIMKREGKASRQQRVSNQVGRNAITVFIITASDFFPGKQETAKVS